MVNSKEGKVEEFVLHRIGAEEEQCVFSDFSAVIKGEEEQDFLRKLFLRPFANMAFTSEFSADGKKEPNILQELCAKAHKGDALAEHAETIARHLLAAAEGHDMPPGELIVARFSDVEVGGAAHEAVGIFKFDDKDIFLESRVEKQNVLLRMKRGLGANKPKKACLVLYTPKGHTLFLIDDQGSTDYWQHDFIRARPKKDHVNGTNDVMQLAKTFITEQLPQDFVVEKADQIDLLNRSVQYFKSHEAYDKEEFANEVFQQESTIRSFNQYSDRFQEEQDVQLQDNFEIAPQAVKRQARVFKSVLKLDKNFHIYIHGDRNKIEQGVDEKGRKFYKIYYEQEA